ncbi:hypothetical protein EsH8_VI_000300 [Colletotrichum jinshuiense]
MAGTSSHSSLESAFREICRGPNLQQLEKWERYIHTTITVDGHSQSRAQFLDQLHNRTGAGDTREVRPDVILVDVDAEGIAARLIHRVISAGLPDQTSESQEIVFAYFVDGRLTRWHSVRDVDGVTAHEQDPAPSQPSPGRSAPAAGPADLKSFYGAYIDSINAKTMARDFDRFCQPELRHNGRRLSIAEYIPLISDSQDAIRGLHFHIQQLLVDEGAQRIAARLEFTGTPVREWGGVRPNGKPVNFHEHVIYQLEDSRILNVWSTIELDVYREQMRQDAP